LQGNEYESVLLYAVSVDKPAESREFAQRIGADGKGVISFPMLSDADHRVIESYGLRDPAYTAQKFDGIPYPAVYVIDKTGRVAWAKVETDYKQRPADEEIRSAVRGVLQ
jgi:peroxiredoxin